MSTFPTPRPSLEAPVTSTRPFCRSTATTSPPRSVLNWPADVHPPLSGPTCGEGDTSDDADANGEGEVLLARDGAEQAPEAPITTQAAARTNHLGSEPPM